jgi:hypothetical protein
VEEQADMDARADHVNTVTADTGARAETGLPRVAEHLEKLLPSEYQADVFFASVWRHTAPETQLHHHHGRRFMRIGNYLYLRSESLGSAYRRATRHSD